MRGTLLFTQPASAKVVTLPTDGVGVEYVDSIKAAAAANTLVAQVNLSRTVLEYYVMGNGRLLIWSPGTDLIP